jgi:hypothetical protein
MAEWIVVFEDEVVRELVEAFESIELSEAVAKFFSRNRGSVPSLVAPAQSPRRNESARLSASECG